MTELFISLYLDEDVDLLIADLVRARGFRVTSTREEGRLGADDDIQLAYASSRHMAMLTHNRVDYEALARSYFDAGQSHCGIIIAVRRPPHDLARRLLVILNRVTADEIKDQLRYI